MTSDLKFCTKYTFDLNKMFIKLKVASLNAKWSVVSKGSNLFESMLHLSSPNVTCLESWGSTCCDAVDLEELPWPAASNDVETKPSGAFDQVCVHRKAPELLRPVCEPCWERPIGPWRRLPAIILSGNPNKTHHQGERTENSPVCLSTTKWSEVTRFRKRKKKGDKYSNQSPDGF